MKPFLDPFPFRAPETRSSIGEVIAEITKAELKAAEAQDLKELPGAAGEAAHKRLHKTIGKFIKSKSVSEAVVQESHTRAQLEKMTTTALRALLKKYTALVAGGSMTAAAELATIRGLLRAKGAGVVLDEASAKVVQARLAARGEKRGGGAAQDKAADAVKIRLGGKGGKPVKEEIELDEMAQTPARAEETRRLRIKARKAAKAAADKLDAIRDTEWNEKKSPDLYGSKGKVVKPTKKMLKTRASTEKAKKTKQVNANKKVQDWDNARKETARKNMKTPLGRAIYRTSIEQGKRSDGGW